MTDIIDPAIEPAAAPPSSDSPPQQSRLLPALGVVLLVVVIVRFFGWWGLVVVGGLLVSIVLHEFGHYLTAKQAGMKVTEFFVGFGPKLFSFTRGETEYGLKPLPLGAYVRIIGMNDLEDVEPGDEGRTYREKSYWARLRVVLAGPAHQPGHRLHPPGGGGAGLGPGRQQGLEDRVGGQGVGRGRRGHAQG